MTTGPAESAAATAARGWRKAAGRLTERRPETSIVVRGVGWPVVRVVHGSSLTVEPGVIIGSGRHSRAVETGIASGRPRSMRKPVAIGNGIEGPEIGVDGRRAAVPCDKNCAAITRIVEIRVVPAVPEEVAVPAKIGVSKTQSVTVAKTITVSHPISKAIGGITIAKASYGCGIIRIVGAIIVKSGKAGIFRFHANIVVAGSGAVIIALVGALGRACASRAAAAGRIIYVISCLRIAGGRATAHSNARYYGNG